MSVFIDVAAVKVKDKNGNYSVPLNAVAAASVEEVVSEVERVKDTIPDDYSGMAEKVNRKIDKPVADDNGKFPRAKDGEVEWVPIGQPTDEQTDAAVSEWLAAHPEATTTVQPGSLTAEQMQADYAKQIENAYVTPEMFYKDADGEDWSYAIQAALDYAAQENHTGCVKLAAKTYSIKHAITMYRDAALEGSGFGTMISCHAPKDEDPEAYHSEENGGYVISIIARDNPTAPKYSASLSNLRINCNGLANGICDGGTDFSLKTVTRIPIHDIIIDKCINGILTTSMGTILHDIYIMKNGAPARQGIGIHFSGTDTIANNIKVANFDIGVKISHGSNRVTNIKSSTNNVGIMLDDVNGCTVHGNTDENHRQGVIIDKAGRCNIAISAVTSSNTSGGAERVPGMEVTRSFGNTIDFAYKLGNSISFAGNESCAIQITDSANNDITCHVTHKTGVRIPAVITDFAQMNNILVNGFRHMRNSIPGELVEWEWTNKAIAIDQSDKNELVITTESNGVACQDTHVDFSGHWHLVAFTMDTADFPAGAFTLSLQGVSGTTGLSSYVLYRDADNNYIHYDLDWDSIKQTLSAPIEKLNLNLQNSGAVGEERNARVRVYAYKV